MVNHVCPNCGYCACCGRYQPYHPVWPRPYIQPYYPWVWPQPYIHYAAPIPTITSTEPINTWRR